MSDNNINAKILTAMTQMQNFIFGYKKKKITDKVAIAVEAMREIPVSLRDDSISAFSDEGIFVSWIVPKPAEFYENSDYDVFAVREPDNGPCLFPNW